MHKSKVVPDLLPVPSSEARSSDGNDTYEDGDDGSGKGLVDVEAGAKAMKLSL